MWEVMTGWHVKNEARAQHTESRGTAAAAANAVYCTSDSDTLNNI
jgi:hypothetical protein